MGKYVTDIEVIEDLHGKLVAGGLDTTITGSIYLKKRPVKSFLEDCVISFTAGVDGQTQTGMCTCNIFVPNIIIDNTNGYLGENRKRIKVISTKLNQIIHDSSIMQKGRYLWQPNTIVSTFELEQADEHAHFVNVEIQFSNNTCYNPEVN